MAVLLAALPWLAGDPALAAVDLWGRQDEFVRIESQDDPGAPQNEHPVDLPAGRVAAMLSALQVRFADAAEPVPLFSRQEVAVLAPALAEGLARAEPRQDITFAIVGSHKTGSLVARRLVNTGRVFYRDGMLNFLFGEVHGEYRKKNVYGQRDQDFRPRRYASRATAANGGWQLEAEGAARRRGERSDWLLLEPALFPATGEVATATATDAGAIGTSGATTAAQGRSIEARLAELKALQEQGLVPEELYVARVKAIIDADVAPATIGIEDRLKALQTLRKRELIPEEVYRSSVESIIDKL